MPKNDAELFTALVDWLTASPPVVSTGAVYIDKANMARCINTLRKRQLTAMLDPDDALNPLETLALQVILKGAYIELPKG